MEKKEEKKEEEIEKKEKIDEEDENSEFDTDEEEISDKIASDIQISDISDDDDTGNDSDSDTVINEKEILKSLIYLSQFKKKKKKEKENEFLPQLKKFFKSNMTKKHKLYNGSIKKIMFFSKININKKNTCRLLIRI